MPKWVWLCCRAWCLNQRLCITSGVYSGSLQFCLPLIRPGRRGRQQAMSWKKIGCKCHADSQTISCSQKGIEWPLSLTATGTNRPRTGDLGSYGRAFMLTTTDRSERLVTSPAHSSHKPLQTKKHHWAVSSQSQADMAAECSHIPCLRCPGLGNFT